jgi:AcrR family transcriptional regulator
MGRTKAEAEETRERILDVAELLFYRNGVKDTPLEQIAAEAGVTRGAIYWHFPDKCEIFRSLMARVDLPPEELIAAVSQGGATDPLSLVERAAHHIIELLAGNERQQRVYSMVLKLDIPEQAPEVRDHILSLKMRQRSHIGSLFFKAEDQGLIAPAWTAVTAERTFFWAITGLLYDWLMRGRSFDLVAEGSDCVTRLMGTFRRG